MTVPVFRFAPSPNGPLHLGHALSALTTFDMARRARGRFLLRIEDIDTARCNDAHVTAMLEDLAWLGLDWERPVLRQSEHFPVYRAAAARLEAMEVLYPCFASRTEIAAAVDPGVVDPDGAPLYRGELRCSPAEAAARRASGEPYALRLDMAAALGRLAEEAPADPLTFIERDAAGRAEVVPADPGRWGDVVILRKEVPASYHLSVVVDDARQGVTHVTRGRDLHPATGLHRLLQVLLGLPEPEYHHHPLLTGADGRKLSKSAGDTGLRALREAGWTPARVRAAVGI